MGRFTDLFGMRYKGYAGRILWINLTHEKVRVEDFPEKLAERYLGGSGICARILYDLIKPGIDPLSPENVLMFATGPLTGTLFPQACRYTVAAKSPLTGIWGESHAAGHWAPELKFAGYDAIIFLGRASKPVYLWIDDDEVEIKDAGEIWGRTVLETDDILREEHGNDVKVACIGPAGENLVRYAAIMNDRYRAAARSGIGAVMGSKNLKAIAVRGSRDIEVADPEAYMEHVRRWHRKMLSHPFMPDRAKYGTTNLIELMQKIGRLPTYNLRQGVFDEYYKIGGEIIYRKYLVKPVADFACLQRCGRYTAVYNEPYRCMGGGPEYETLCSLGSRCGISNIEAILYGNWLCNNLGLDSVSAGGTISWAMECYELGLISRDELDGLDLRFGNEEAMIELLIKIAYRKGVGDLLAEGSWRVAKKIGRGTERYVMHVKGQEIASQEPRAQKSMGLAIATAARGADHLYGFPVLDEVGFEKEIRERFGEEYLPEIADRLNPKYKGFMVKECEDYMAVVEAVGVCKYGTQIPPVFYYQDIVDALRVTCGMDVDVRKLKLIGERIVNLNRAFNIREGVSRRDDTLPERLTKVPAPLGPAKGHVVELDQMLDEYYRCRGWDLETGKPTYEKLVSLGLEDVAEDLLRKGLIRKAET